MNDLETAAARFISGQLDNGVPPLAIIKTARSRWPGITTGELVRANATALAQRSAKVASDAAAVGRFARSNDVQGLIEAERAAGDQPSIDTALARRR